MLNYHIFKIIDFISSIKKCDNYIEQDIVSFFLEGNSITKYLKRTVVCVAINRTFEQNKIKTNKIVEMKKKMNKKKCIFEKSYRKT